MVGEKEKEENRIKELQKEIAKLSTEELKKIQSHVQSELNKKQTKLPQHLPVSIFSTRLSPAEAVVKYLKEHHALTFSEIAKLINRDQRGIWGSYSRARKKHPERFDIKLASYTIPVSCFNDRSRSILEHVVTYLKDSKGLKPAEICTLLNKKTSTIWTAYQRSRRKQNA
ncbi:MAG: hypothetical protein QXT19_04115 [Candidatus Woesearchaeota archaeon]